LILKVHQVNYDNQGNQTKSNITTESEKKPVEKDSTKEVKKKLHSEKDCKTYFGDTVVYDFCIEDVWAVYIDSEVYKPSKWKKKYPTKFEYILISLTMLDYSYATDKYDKKVNYNFYVSKYEYENLYNFLSLHDIEKNLRIRCNPSEFNRYFAKDIRKKLDRYFKYKLEPMRPYGWIINENVFEDFINANKYYEYLLNNSNKNRQFKGKTNDLRVYNRAITAEEVTALYNLASYSCSL
jgi:hypothetical protein